MKIGKFILAVLILSAVVYLYRNQTNFGSSFGELNAAINKQEYSRVFGNNYVQGYNSYLPQPQNSPANSYYNSPAPPVLANPYSIPNGISPYSTN